MSKTIKPISTKELIATLATELAMSKKDTREVLYTVVNTIADTALEGDGVRIEKFGKFYLFTGKDGKPRPKFKAATALKKAAAQR